MAYYCWKCGNEQIFEVKVGVKVGRKDECPHCGADLHVCKNCNLYQPALHNQCREPNAEWVTDRDRRNFCDYFSLNSAVSTGIKTNRAQDARTKLDQLFKPKEPNPE